MSVEYSVPKEGRLVTLSLVDAPKLEVIGAAEPEAPALTAEQLFIIKFRNWYSVCSQSKSCQQYACPISHGLRLAGYSN